MIKYKVGDKVIVKDSSNFEPFKAYVIEAIVSQETIDLYGHMHIRDDNGIIQSIITKYLTLFKPKRNLPEWW